MSIRTVFAQVGIVALGVSLGASFVFAADNMAVKPERFYISGAVGASMPRDSDFTGPGVDVSADFDNGMGIAGAIGREFGRNWRGEFEIGYRTNDVDTISGAAATGSFDSLSIMVNGLYDIPTNWRLTPYVGVGVGFARIDAQGVSPIGGSVVDNSDNALAYQGIAGLSYALSDSLDLFADYRYLATTDLDYVTNSGTRVDSEFATHQAMVGLRIFFGGPEKAAAKPAAAPAPPPPPPPPAPQAAPAPPPPDLPRNYLVFFDWDRSDIRPDARSVIAEAAKNYPELTVIEVQTTGHADRSGPDQYNVGLSRRRAQAVASELIKLGVPTGEIAIDWKGEREPLVQTADGVREPQNRRVEIILRQ